MVAGHTVQLFIRNLGDTDWVPLRQDMLTSAGALDTTSDTYATGAAAIAVSAAPADDFWFDGVQIHFSAVPTTSENLTITLNSTFGAEYDVLLAVTDPYTDNVTDLIWRPDEGPMPCQFGDSIDVAFTNTGTKTYGVWVMCRVM